MKNFNYLLLLFFFYLVSCGSLKEATKVLRNEKIKTTDEFLVKKRQPLVLPPDYDTLPTPGTLKGKTDNNNINKILKIPDQPDTSKSSSTSIEQSIINKIGK
jgi:hypothetical protein